MKIFYFILILLVTACSPNGSTGGSRNFATQGSLNTISSSDCDTNGGEWKEGGCRFEIPIAEAKTSEECQVSGGVWSDTKNFCIEKRVSNKKWLLDRKFMLCQKRRFEYI